MRMPTIEKHRVKAAVGAAALACGLAAGLALGGPDVSTAEAAAKTPNKPTRNVIVMISDGWGYNQIAATDYFTGEKQAYENFPVKFAMSTYSVKWYDPLAAWTDFSWVKTGATDSAAAATAMASGEKTYDAAIGVDLTGARLDLVTEYAEEAGKATGVVSSVEFSHATPAGFVAHNVSRNNYAAIANEMINDSATDVIMGCGAPDYDDSGNAYGATITESRAKYVGGLSTWADITDDGRVSGADADADGFADDWTVIRDRGQFQTLAEGETPERVLGIPRVYTTLQQARGGDGKATPFTVPLTETVPTLGEMSKAALNVLDNDQDGFFLMIEGGAVDWAGHANQSGRVIEEQMDFNAAVEAVINWVKQNSNWGETLLVVTGDHETGYLWGPGSGTIDGSATYNPIVDNGSGNLPGMQWYSGDHTNQLIPFFAKGDAGLLFKWNVDGADPVRGKYIDNTDLGDILIEIVQ